MKVLLVQHSRRMGEAYPLGLGYVAAVLLEAGHEVSFLDLALLEGDGAALVRERALRFGAGAVGLTALTPTYGEALDLVRTLRPSLPGVGFVMGGHHPTIFPDRVLREGGADVVVLSEGELIAPDLFGTLGRGGDLGSVPGIAFLAGDGRCVRTAPAGVVTDLGHIPYAPWEIFRPSAYRGRLRGRRLAHLLASRGCPFRCAFCNRGPEPARRYRKRSPEHVLREVGLLRREHGIEAFTFWDDTFTLDMDHAAELCRRLARDEPGVVWKCQTRVDRVNLDLLRQMRRAGCVGVSFGVESGSEAILERMNKGVTKEQARKAFAECRQAGLPTLAYFMIGTPWETPATVEETIAFAVELKATSTVFFIATPYPDTGLEKAFVEAGWRVPEDPESCWLTAEGYGRSARSGAAIDPRRDRFADECRRASRAVLRARLGDPRGYPRLLRELLRKHGPRELAAQVLDAGRRAAGIGRRDRSRQS